MERVEDPGGPGHGSGDEHLLLPCKIRRNYACKMCAFASNNPRHFLYHQRDDHGQRGAIHECPFCVYASSHTHKLLRHIRLVHSSLQDSVAARLALGVAVSEVDLQAQQQHLHPRHQALPPQPRPPPVVLTVPRRPPLPFAQARPQPYLSGSTLAARLTGGSALPKDLEVILVGGGAVDNRIQHRPQQQLLQHVRHQATPPLSLIRLPPKTPIATVVRQNPRPDVVLFPLAQQAGAAPRTQSTIYYSVIKSAGGPAPVGRRRPSQSGTQQAPRQLHPAPAAVTARRRSSGTSTTTSGSTLQQQPAKPPEEFSCSVCPFRSRSRVLVQRHEKVSHLKKKFFRCQRCPYVTNVRARYTKHVRYHSMPYIKCEKCDFSTPYKWNLDRHRRNHLEGGSGEPGASTTESATGDVFRCNRCSFACHSKQSLSVHLMHHHSESGEGGRRPRRMERRDDAPRLLLRLPRRPVPEEVTPRDGGEEEPEVEEYDVEADGAGEEEEEDREESGDERLLEEAEGRSDETQPVSYACAECGETFSDVDQLDRHAYAAHVVDRGGRRNGGGISSGRPEISCGLCPYKAKWISEVVRHRRVHAKEKPYRCPNCDFRSRWKGDMTRHVHKHHGGESAVAGTRQPPGAELSGIDQLLDQSMQVGGENELSLYVDADDAPEQESPLDLSRPVPPPRASHSLELLPMLLRMPPRPTVQRPAVADPAPEPVAAEEPSATKPANDVEPLITPTVATPVITQSVGEPAVVAASPKPKTVAPSTIRKCYQCPHCPFRSSTASRFHMHMVVHANSKPYGCSVCPYRSNWQWDITKHAKIKSARDPGHLNAFTVLVNDTGSRNYEKYDRYVVYETVKPAASGLAARKVRGLAAVAAAAAVVAKLPPVLTSTTTVATTVQRTPSLRSPKKRRRRVSFRCKYCEFRHDQRRVIRRHMEVHTGNKNFWCGICGQSSNGHAVILRHCRVRHGVSGPIMQRDADPDHPLPTYDPAADAGFISEEEEEEEKEKEAAAVAPEVADVPKSIATAEAPEKSPEADPPPAATTSTQAAPEEDKSKADAVAEGEPTSAAAGTKETPASSSEDEQQVHRCKICPYQCRKMFDLRMHSYMHKPHEGAIFKCAFCPFFVSLKSSWIQHMRLHVEQPSDLVGRYVSDANDNPVTAPEAMPPASPQTESTSGSTATVATTVSATCPKPPQPASKRYTCGNCPYTTDSHSTILYHRQFHRHNPSAQFRCDRCSYAVSRCHLLNQHLRVHGVLPPPLPPAVPMRMTPEPVPPPEEPEPASGKSVSVPRVWVHRNGVFARMFRCRHCPHVSKKRGVIVEHEKMHDRSQRPLDGKSTYECALCNYSCRNAGILTTHMKVHGHAVGVQPYVSAASNGPALADPATTEEKPPDASSHSGDAEPKVEDSESTTSDSFRESGGAHGWTREEEESSARHCFLKVGSAKPNTVYRPCGRCPAKFYKPDQLATHRSHHGAGLAFGCRICDFSSSDRKAWRRHVRVHSADYQRGFRDVAPPATNGDDTPRLNGHAGRPPQTKDACSSPVVQRDAMVEVRRYHCHLCPASFIKNSSLIFHSSLHGVNNKYKCSRCSYSVTSVGNLVRHVKVHNGGRTVASQSAPSPVEYLHCPKCPAFFTRAKIMHYQTHVGLHGSRLHFACRICDYATNSATTLNRHRHVHENAAAATDLQMPPPPPPPSPGRRRNSQTSPKSSPTMAVVERQQQMLEKLRAMAAAAATDPGPLGQKIYSCERCPYVHPRRGAVVSHMRRHRVVGAGPETTCPYCDYSCTVASFLRDHVRLHVGSPTEPRHGLPDCSVPWDSMEVWSRHADRRTLVYRYPNSSEEEISAPARQKSERRTRQSTRVQAKDSEPAEEVKEVSVLSDPIKTKSDAVSAVLDPVTDVPVAGPGTSTIAAVSNDVRPSCSFQHDHPALTTGHEVDPAVVAGLCDDLVASVSAVLSDDEADDCDDVITGPQTDVGDVVHGLLDAAVQLASQDTSTAKSAKTATCNSRRSSIESRPIRRVSRELNGTHRPATPQPAITKEELLGHLSLIPMLKKPATNEIDAEVISTGEESGRPRSFAAASTNGTTAIELSSSKGAAFGTLTTAAATATQNGHSDNSGTGHVVLLDAPRVVIT